MSGPSTVRIVFAACAALLFGLPAARSADGAGEGWPQWLGPHGDSVWRETGILEKFPDGGPKVRWRTPIGGGYSGPAVAHGKVYVTDRVLAQGASNPANQMQRGSIPGAERVLCLNETDGAIVWKHEDDCAYTFSFAVGPRTTPVVSGDKVYTLGAEGNLLCLDAEKGTLIWSHDLKKDYGAKTQLWGFSSNPLLEGNKLIVQVGGIESTVVAFDKDTGKEVWKSLAAPELGYSSPAIGEFGGKREVIVWLPDGVYGLDPETGKELWSQKYVSKMGMVIATPRKLGDLVFVSSFFNGPMMLKLDGDKPVVQVAWRGNSAIESKPDGIHCVMSTPFLEDGYIYGTCSYGQLRCLKADTGERVWESLDYLGGQPVRWGNAFLVKNGDRFFLLTEQGNLIIAKLSPKGYEDISRAHLLDATTDANGRPVVWSHPAFADKCIFARNDKEIVCASLAADGK